MGKSSRIHRYPQEKAAKLALEPPLPGVFETFKHLLSADARKELHALPGELLEAVSKKFLRWYKPSINAGCPITSGDASRTVIEAIELVKMGMEDNDWTATNRSEGLEICRYRQYTGGIDVSG